MVERKILWGLDFRNRKPVRSRCIMGRKRVGNNHLAQSHTWLATNQKAAKINHERRSA